MVDILNLRNGMEDNLLLIQQINLKEGEEQEGLDDVIHAAQQHIESIITVYKLGLSWLKDDVGFVLKFIQGNNVFWASVLSQIRLGAFIYNHNHTLLFISIYILIKS